MKKVFTKKAMVVSLLCGLAGVSHAEDIGYTYAQGGFSNGNDEADTNILTASGSYAINENMYVKGSFSSASGDADGVDVDGTAFDLGVGYHTNIADKTDVYGEVGFVKQDIDFKVGSTNVATEKSDGVGFGVGVRSRLNDMFEVEAAVSHFDSDTSVDVQGLYHLSNQFAVGVRADSINESDKSFGAFARVKSF